MALVSIIMPCYNSAAYLPAAIDSVLAQTETDWELEIVDDCSSDNSPEVLQPYREKYPNIHYTRMEKNGGPAAARSEGIRRAGGSFIAFLDSDDCWHPEKLAQQLALQRRSGADLIYTGARCMNSQGERIDRFFHVPEQVDYETLLRGNHIICSSVLVRAEVIRRFPMVRSDLHEDFICWLSLLKAGHTAAGIDRPLVFYRLTDNSKSRSKLKSARMTWQVYRYMKLPLGRCITSFAAYILHGLRRYKG